MESRLIIGCNKCVQHVLIPTTTSYKLKDFEELINEPYLCPFCQEQLFITPRMWKILFILLNKMFHVEIVSKFLMISCSEITLQIPTDRVINSVVNYIKELGIKLENAEKYLPSTSDINLINAFRSEYDHTKWTIKIQSENVLKPF